MPSRVILRVIKGLSKGKELILDKPTTCVIGRSEDCDFVLGEMKKGGLVSRRHCILNIDPPRAWIRDLGSLNGTYVNGVKVGQRTAGKSHAGQADTAPPRHELFHGDQIRVGNTVIELTTQVPKVCIKCGGEIAKVDEINTFQGGGFFLCFACNQEVDPNLLFSLEKELAKARRYGTPFSALALSFVEVKSKGETPSKGFSNQSLITAIDERISTITRDSDIIGKMGFGKVFVLLPMTSSVGAKLALERYLNMMHSKPVDAGSVIVNVRMAGVMTCLDQTFKGGAREFLESISADLARMEAKVRSHQV
jgi:pSer/pThr/pTyr-binding forkhead associated (FHA) protein